MKYYFFILFTILIAASCNDNGKEQKKNLKCDLFDYENGIDIRSKFKIDSLATIVQYEKNNKKKVIDTIRTKVEDRTKYTKENYVIGYRPLNTGYDYEIILNDTMRYFFTDITSVVAQRAAGLFKEPHYVCDINSFKLNGISERASQLSIIIESSKEK